MRKLTKKEYSAYLNYKSLGAQMGDLKRKQKEEKERLLKAFGRAKKAETPNGTTLKVQVQHVTPTKVPAPYSFPRFLEIAK